MKFPLKLKIKAICILFSNIVSSQFLIAVCKSLFRNPSAVIFLKFNRLIDLNFNMNKIQGTLFNFGVKKSRIEGVCDPENKILHLKTTERSPRCIKEGKTTSVQKKMFAFTRKYCTWTAI